MISNNRDPVAKRRKNSSVSSMPSPAVAQVPPQASIFPSRMIE
jgi:hypothetical protein